MPALSAGNPRLLPKKNYLDSFQKAIEDRLQETHCHLILD